jgi:mannose-6-phosphate isomerase-like protein (cupin superfamily)
LTTAQARVVLPGDARVIGIGAFDVVVLAEDGTDGRFSLIETREPEAGVGPPLHIHRDAAESFYVIAGSYRMHVGGEDHICPAGSFVYVPAGTTHTFASLEGGSRKLNLYTPSAMVGYFDELAAAIAAGVDDEAIDAIAGEYAMEVVGPIPVGYVSHRADR